MTDAKRMKMRDHDTKTMEECLWDASKVLSTVLFENGIGVNAEHITTVALAMYRERCEDERRHVSGG